MPVRKRVQKNTVEGQLITAKSVRDRLQPVSALTDVEMTHFDRVVSSREAETWSPHDLSIATQLAKTLRRFEELQTQLDSDGLTLVNERGTTHAHPLLSASMTMSNTIQALSRTLGLSASQRAITGEHQAGRNKAEQAARKVLERAAADDLLA